MRKVRNPQSTYRSNKRAIALLLLIVFGGSSPNAAARAVDELFADGNRLFRDDLFWAALLRYRQASDAGMDTPLLHYNTGVAHYKAQQYIRARESLIKAARSSRLQVVSHYNLGLNSWAAGDTNDALRWFRKARDQQQSKGIRSLARKAIKRIRLAERKEDALVVVLAEKKQKEKEVSTFELRASIGGGTDSNAFRSPSEPYVDLSNPALPLVVPDVQQGFYIPVAVRAKYSVHSFEHESFFGAYRFSGRFYQDSALSNADEFLHELSFGTEYKRREGSRTRQVYSAFSVAQHDEVYYDRDTGVIRSVNNIDITDRFDYLRYGPTFSFRQSHDRFSIGARLKAQLWNYEDAVQVPEYDHEYFLLGLNTQYRFTRTSLLRITADAYQRNFGARPSFELDGTQPIGNPPVEYDYLELGVTARQRVTPGLWFGINYVRTDREDKYLGYNSYVKDSYGAEIHWRIGNRFSLEATANFQVYDYENAFAFQNPAAGRKTLERTIGKIKVAFDLTRHLDLLAEYRYEDLDSNDARIAYNRSRIGLTIRWSN